MSERLAQLTSALADHYRLERGLEGGAGVRVRRLRGDRPSTLRSRCPGVAAILALVGLIACLIPAARATLIDPTVAMRAD